jgi:hypothetical protein
VKKQFGKSHFRTVEQLSSEDPVAQFGRAISL